MRAPLGSAGSPQLVRAPRRGRLPSPAGAAQAAPTGFSAALEAQPPAAAARATPAAVDRVLIGGRGEHRAEARIRIVDGGGQAIELHLVAAPDGKTIGLRILTLTATTGSRETLSDVMKEVRLRLRRRGIVLRDDDSRQERAR